MNNKETKPAEGITVGELSALLARLPRDKIVVTRDFESNKANYTAGSDGTWFTADSGKVLELFIKPLSKEFIEADKKALMDGLRRAHPVKTRLRLVTYPMMRGIHRVSNRLIQALYKI